MSDEWKDSDAMEDAAEMADNAIRAGKVECLGGFWTIPERMA